MDGWICDTYLLYFRRSTYSTYIVMFSLKNETRQDYIKF